MFIALVYSFFVLSIADGAGGSLIGRQDSEQLQFVEFTFMPNACGLCSYRFFEER